MPLTTAMWRVASALWADARQQHRQTAPDHALDGEVLLAAQALALAEQYDDDDVVVATTNIKHLDRYVTDRRWNQIG